MSSAASHHRLKEMGCMQARERAAAAALAPAPAAELAVEGAGAPTYEVYVGAEGAPAAGPTSSQVYTARSRSMETGVAEVQERSGAWHALHQHGACREVPPQQHRNQGHAKQKATQAAPPCAGSSCKRRKAGGCQKQFACLP